ncbi:hypothetical protein PACTADRAFT_45626 [Pachysolen tannophilus NRRL Y-2460]|uniref:Major facilitator superfamily (MFS) profile domain-containing protein n=1 Tax=Pachysolen tannophilus NRRL Y-2460 TaxID=669874 RepID=A0A1E4TPM5_PACTA|nr:hypothetical protein PACTADRAFT_45626 [Pachysolen tannophilus NRRL Y-2460]
MSSEEQLGESNFLKNQGTKIDIKSLEVVKSHSEKELDLGAEFLAKNSEHADYTPAEARKVLFKIDLMLMPIMTVATTLAAADKIVISNAALYGMETDCKLVGQQYSWIASIFYFGYLGMEAPANYLIQRYPVAKCLGISFIIWSSILMCIGAANNFATLAALRFLLGMGETFLFPALTVITSMFYRKKEQPFRTAIWFSGFSSLITGSLSYGIGTSNSSVASWRLLFITFGAITFGISWIMLILIPDSPMKCRFFSTREKYIAIDRTKENRTGTKNKVFKKDQAIEALLSPTTWCMAIFVFSINIANGGLVSFAAQIVSGLGYSEHRTVLMGLPTGVFMTFSSWLIALPCLVVPGKFRTVITAIVTLCPLICCVLMMKLTDKISRLLAYYFFYFYWGPYVSMCSLSMANTSGHTKKTVVNAINFISYCVANIVAPQFFLSSQSPEYPTGYDAILSFLAVSIVTILIYGLLCILENKKRNKKYGIVDSSYKMELDILDLTDIQKAEVFRYTW